MICFSTVHVRLAQVCTYSFYSSGAATGSCAIKQHVRVLTEFSTLPYTIFCIPCCEVPAIWWQSLQATGVLVTCVRDMRVVHCAYQRTITDTVCTICTTREL